MDRREQILCAALEIAAESGLGGLSMSRIAERVGIQKPSLYNHFASKDEIVSAMYGHFRDKAKAGLSADSVDSGELMKGRSAEEILTGAAANYMSMNSNEQMLRFYRVIYSARASDPAAAAIMAEETRRMINITKNIFYALQVHGKIHADDIDEAAVSFAMTVHALTDHRLDCLSAGLPMNEDMVPRYIKWFCRQIGGSCDEKDDDK